MFFYEMSEDLKFMSAAIRSESCGGRGVPM